MHKIDPEVLKTLVARVMDSGASHACGMFVMHGARKSKGQTAKEALNEALQELLREAVRAGIEQGYAMGESVFGSE